MLINPSIAVPNSTIPHLSLEAAAGLTWYTHRANGLSKYLGAYGI